jgi:CRISPR/Cas system-associated endonuclease Cas1
MQQQGSTALATADSWMASRNRESSLTEKYWQIWLSMTPKVLHSL